MTAALLSITACASVGSKVAVYEPGELGEKELGLYNILEDTVWQGRLRITGDVFVKEGVTLTIMPGTVIRFDSIAPKLEADGGRNMLGLDAPYFPQAELIVRGRLIAVGTPDQPIVFTSSDKAAMPGAWGAVSLLGSNGNIIEFCRFYYAYNGIHNHSSTAVVINNVFSQNGTAISFNKEGFEHPCWMFIEHNTITGNKSGISARNSIVNIAFNNISDNEFYGIWVKNGNDARIAYNDITRNGKGIYLFKAEPTKISYNNIYDNVEYNIALAEENANDVNAANNWWGTTDPAAISRTIFDKGSDETLGKVNFEPMMKHEVTGTTR